MPAVFVRSWGFRPGTFRRMNAVGRRQAERQVDSLDHFYEYERDWVLMGIHMAAVNHMQGVNGKVAGNLAAFSQIKDAAIILHGPKGCAYHYRYFARRRYLPAYNIDSSDLCESDVVTGGEDKLMALARRVIAERKPGCVILIPTVTSDVMQCDLTGLARQLRAETGCPVLAVESEVFSHIDKTVMRAGRKDMLKSWGKACAPASSDYKGCGFSEAMLTLAEQLMEPQEPLPGTVNVEGYAWGYGGRALLEGMDGMLWHMNLRLLNCLPNCTAAEIVRAPAAQLNIARRVRWAKALNQRFGTPYMHIHGFARYTGLDGILQFYREIAQTLELNLDVDRVFARHIDRARERLAACSEAYRGLRVLLMPRMFNQLPNLLVQAVKGAGIPIAHVVARMEPKRLALNDMDDEMARSALDNVRKAMELCDLRCELTVNPDEAQLKEILRETDLVIGDEFVHGLCPDKPVIADDLFITALDFENLCRGAEMLAANLGKYPTGGRLLIHRAEFEPELYPHLAGDGAAASRELWQRLWQNRGR